MNKIKKIFLTLSGLVPILVLASCATTPGGDYGNNLWSIPSKKIGMDKAPQSKLDQVLSKNTTEFDVDNFFINLKLKNFENKTKEDLVKELQKELENKNDQPFNGSTTLSASYTSFLKATIVNKYFQNDNKIFPSWLIYDVRAKIENEKLILTISIVDFGVKDSASDIKDLSLEAKNKFISQKVFEF